MSEPAAREHPGAREHVLVVGVMTNEPGDAASDTVLTEAIRFARMLSAELVLANVDTTRYTTKRNADGTVSAFPIDPDSAESVTEEFDAGLAEHVTALLENSGIRWSLRALAGDPAHELARLAHEVNALAIVVGTRKRGLRTTAHEFFNGSVAVHLAHRQHHPVIVIPLDPVAHDDPLPWEV